MRLLQYLLLLLASLFSPWLLAATCQSVFPGTIIGNSPNQLNLSGIAWQNSPTLGAINRSLGAGDYYFGGGNSGNNWTLSTTGGASTRVFVNGGLSLANGSQLNAGGNPQDLVLVVNGSLALGNNVTIRGFVYATGGISFGNNLTLNGAITSAGAAGSPTGSSLTYNGSAIDQADFANLCEESTQLRLSWALDEASWTGTAGEVLDASGNALHGTVFNGASTANTAPALPQVNALGTCGYGGFNSASSQYVQRADSNLLDLQSSFTIGLWVKPRSLPASGLMSILSKDENYEFHLNPSGTINWWWQTTGPSATREFNSTTALTVGQWSHVLIRYAPGDQRIYINGSLAGQASFGGTPVVNGDPLQLGADQGTAGRYFDGQLDELRIYSGALSDAQISALVAERHQCALRLQCFNDDFNDGSLDSDWAVASRGATAFTPTVSSQRMRLTSNQGNVATSSTLQRLFPAAGNYIQVQFKHYAYNGSGADGVAVVLSDATVTPQPGAFGGPLGYGTRGDAANPGFAGGWLGVGIDEFGNFSTEGGPGGPGQRADSVAIRGSGGTGWTSGYRYIAGTTANLNPGIDSAASTAAAPGHTYRITMDGRFSNEARVTVERDSGSGFVVLPNLNAVNVLAAANSQAALPGNFYLSLTGSTGGSTNIHELDDLQVCATTINPIGQQIDHFEFIYTGSALTCNPQPVTIRACLNSSCSSLYTNPVSVTLSPANYWTTTAPATVSGNVISFSGGTAVAQLRVPTAGTVSLKADASVPATKPNSQTVCSTAGCQISYAASGLLLQVPDMLAAKPTPASISAVRSSDNALQCVPAFANVTRSVSFTSAYSNPTSGTQPVVVNGVNVGSTPVGLNLAFDANGTAPLTVRYDDAGLMTLNASYTGSVANGDEGLVMAGADNFIARPVGLCLYSDTPNSDCAAGDASCSKFVVAGDPFRLRVGGVAWQADIDNNLCSGNLRTPNYQQSGITLASALVAPAGGSSGSLGVSPVDIAAADSGEKIITNQSISEVGVFTITATPPASYLGGPGVGNSDGSVDNSREVISTSANLGRFYPASFQFVDPILTPACNGSTYAGLAAQAGPPAQPLKAGQAFVFEGSLSARNRSGGVTQNYIGSFAKLTASDLVYTDSGLVGTVSTAGSTLTVPGTNGAGHVNYRATTPSFLFNLPRAPYALAITSTATDSDGVTGSVVDTATPLPDFRLGQARIGNAYGSELQSLLLPFTAAFFNGSGYAPNPLDSCTSFSPANLDSASYLGNLANGETLLSYRNATGGGTAPFVVSAGSSGAGGYLLSAPGAGNDGSVRVAFPTPTWLRFDWDGNGSLDHASGLATFGIYKGAAPLIFRREVYR
ncbi:DUF6701 domain-containing protein [Pseudomonas sp. F(2018)]|uniref:DUF6701 domain-containing protein n=1 Tax=Pseudomonas sp. F(2018) TaxID=2502240 RepID=UPI0010F5A929|nr:DUF6701 domain-containing protein [Pseudomonas sp. F(2018)]